MNTKKHQNKCRLHLTGIPQTYRQYKDNVIEINWLYVRISENEVTLPQRIIKIMSREET